MANRFSVTPLGGVNIGAGLQGLNKQFEEQRRYETEQQQMADQQRQQEDLRAFAVQAQSGDPVAMKELFARDPRLAMMMEQREAEKSAVMNAQQMAESKKAEVDWGIRWKQTQDPAAKEALLQEAVSNPLIDIDENDIGIEGPQADLAVNMMLYGHMGDKAYNQFLGGQQGDIKTETIQTPTGAIVINKQTGETVKDITIPEKQAEFEAKKAERKQLLQKKKRDELAAIDKAKIQKQEAADARQDALSTTTRAFALTKELGDKNVIAPVTGWYDRMTPTGNKSQDVINKALELKDLLTLNNLGLMSGVLTDRDIQILARAGSGLNVDDDGFLGSEEGVVRQIKKVENMLDTKLKQAVKRGDLSQLDYEKIKSGESEAQQADGKIMVDAQGNRAMVYPGGTFKEL